MCDDRHGRVRNGPCVEWQRQPIPLRGSCSQRSLAADRVRNDHTADEESFAHTNKQAQYKQQSM